MQIEEPASLSTPEMANSNKQEIVKGLSGLKLSN
jgi:hypothetical protein